MKRMLLFFACMLLPASIMYGQNLPPSFNGLWRCVELHPFNQTATEHYLKIEADDIHYNVKFMNADGSMAFEENYTGDNVSYDNEGLTFKVDNGEYPPFVVDKKKSKVSYYHLTTIFRLYFHKWDSRNESVNVSIVRLWDGFNENGRRIRNKREEIRLPNFWRMNNTRSYESY